LGVGVNRVWIDPTKLEEVSSAITRRDVRGLIDMGVIRAREVRGISRGRLRERKIKRKKGRRRGPGSRKGGSKARLSSKERWIRRVRPLREKLRELRAKGAISASEYRRLYRKISGGYFRSKAHLEAHLREKESQK